MLLTPGHGPVLLLGLSCVCSVNTLQHSIEGGEGEESPQVQIEATQLPLAQCISCLNVIYYFIDFN